MQRLFTITLRPFFAALALFITTAQAQEGALDPTFSGDGKVVTPIGSGSDIRASLVQPDGKLVVGGISQDAGTFNTQIRSFTIARYNTNGTLDAAFGNNGIVLVNFDKLNDLSNIFLLPDGKIVAAGTTQTGDGRYTIALARLNPDGSLDATYGTGGKRWIPMAGEDVTSILYLLPDGRLVAAGTIRNNFTDMVVTRYLPDGTPDPSFSGDGRVVLPVIQVPRAITVQPDGKTVVGGMGRGPQGNNFSIVRLTADGALDTGFGGDGEVRTGFGAQDYVLDLAQQPDGKLIASGVSHYDQGDVTYTRAATARYNLDGSPDTTFNRNGFTTSGLSTRDYNHDNSVAVQQDGKIVVVWTANGQRSSYPYPSENNFEFKRPDLAVIRYNPDGSPDATFGKMGELMIDNNGGVDRGLSVAVAGNRIYASGAADGNYYGYYWDHSHFFVTALTTSNSAAPYTLIPAKIEAEAWSAMWGVQAQPTADTGGGQNVGYIDYGDWIAYHVKVPASGTYRLQLRLATPNSNAQFELYANARKLATVNVPKTASYQTYSTHTLNVDLPAGAQIIRLQSTGGGYWNINWLEFAGGPAPTEPAYVTIPAQIEAENHTGMYGVQKENTTDAGGGQNVGYIDYGDWMEYRINVPTAGTYAIGFRVATPNSNAQFQVRSGNTLLATVNVPNTGGFQRWQTHTINVPLMAGNQTIRILSTGGAYWNINWLQFTGSTLPPVDPAYVTIPAKIEAEHYTGMYGVQKENTTDAGGGQNVGYIDFNDWVEYRINVPVAGTYLLNLRLASTHSDGWIHITQAEGAAPRASVNVPNTGGFQQWQTVSISVPLVAGNQVLRLTSAGGFWNINWLDFGARVEPQYTLLPAKIEAEAFEAKNSGVVTEPTTDAGGGENIRFVHTYDWTQYSIEVPASGLYSFRFRYATPHNDAGILIRNSPSKERGAIGQTGQLPSTGGWQNWQTYSKEIFLNAGRQTIYIEKAIGSFNLNWIEIVPQNATTFTGKGTNPVASLERSSTAVSVFPNPIREQFTLKVDNPLRGQVNVQVAGANGAVLKTYVLNKAAAGAQFYNLVLQGLPKGIYTLQVQMKGWKFSSTIIRQ